MTSRIRHSRGFTLIELMVVIAIIGVLASVAIPSFLNYQNSTKRAEAFANVATLAKTQKTYYAENGVFHTAVAEPSSTLGVDPSIAKRSFETVTAFDTVGWTPEGQVFFDYDSNTPDGPDGAADCTCSANCFTASAYGDLDGDLAQSVIVYAQPDASGDFCVSMIHKESPPVTPDGDYLFSEAVRAVGSAPF